jgi:hypothetical protein
MSATKCYDCGTWFDGEESTWVEVAGKQVPLCVNCANEEYEDEYSDTANFKDEW